MTTWFHNLVLHPRLGTFYGLRSCRGLHSTNNPFPICCPFFWPNRLSIYIFIILCAILRSLTLFDSFDRFEAPGTILPAKCLVIIKLLLITLRLPEYVNKCYIKYMKYFNYLFSFCLSSHCVLHFLSAERMKKTDVCSFGIISVINVHVSDTYAIVGRTH